MSSTSKLSVILGVEGVEKVIADANRAKTALTNNLKPIQTASLDVKKGLGQMQSATQAVAAQAITSGGPLSQLAQGLLAFGPAGPVTIGFTLGMAAIMAAMNDAKAVSIEMRTELIKTADAYYKFLVETGKMSPEMASVAMASLGVEQSQQAFEDRMNGWGASFKKFIGQATGYWAPFTNTAVAAFQPIITKIHDLETAQARLSNTEKKETEEQLKKRQQLAEQLRKQRELEEAARFKMHSEDMKRIHDAAVAQLAFHNQSVQNRLKDFAALSTAQERLLEAQERLNVATGKMTEGEARLNILERELDKATQLYNVMKTLAAFNLISPEQLEAFRQAVEVRRLNRDAETARQEKTDEEKKHEQTLKHLEEVAQYASVAADAWTAYWEAVFSGQNVFGSLAKLAAKALAQIARLEMGKELASAFASLAKYDPKSAALHFKSAAMWGVLSGAASALGNAGGGSGGYANNRGGLDNTINNQNRPRTNITIVGDPYFDTRDPDKMDALVRAIREAGNGDIVIRGA